MIRYQDALDLIEQQAVALPTVTAPIDACRGLIAAEDVFSPVTLPPFDNSAMDGYAVRAEMIKEASADRPVILKVMGRTTAGDRAGSGNDGVWEIMTGAPVPEGYDTIVKVEDTECLARDKHGRAAEVKILNWVHVGNNIRRAGEDLIFGNRLISTGTRIDNNHIMLLAATGFSDLKVYRKPKITILGTGKELSTDNNLPLAPGQIHNSNSPYLISCLDQAQCEAYIAGPIHDDVKTFYQKLAKLLKQNPDIIISTGAVSMGCHDFIPGALKDLGAEILFHKSAIKPGKPILFARLPNGTFYFGLPGNPIACAVGLRFFVMPMIRKMRKQQREQAATAVLKNSYKKKNQFRHFLKANKHIDGYGRQVVHILKGQESFKMAPLLQTNCWVIAPETTVDLESGNLVSIFDSGF